jgi:uncharacterized membrane protein YhaH (DUF805 family)
VAQSGKGRTPAPLLWLLFGLRGRISRGVYWLSFFFLRFLQAAIIMQILGGEQASLFGLATSLGVVVLLASLAAGLIVSVKRLHDIGYSGFLSCALFIPFVDLAFSIWVGILPGTPGPNRFGAVVDARPE